MRKEEGNPRGKSSKEHKISLSLVTKCLRWIGDLERLWSFQLCLVVNARALVMNVILRNLGCLWWWWLGVFIALNHQTTVGAGCCWWAHRTVRCASHVTQPLGFWSFWSLEALSSSGIRQSGAAPDRHCSVSGAPLTCGSDSARTIPQCSSCSRPLREVAFAPLSHRTVRWHTG
jgi:hypothetical protein